MKASISPRFWRLSPLRRDRALFGAVFSSSPLRRLRRERPADPMQGARQGLGLPERDASGGARRRRIAYEWKVLTLFHDPHRSATTSPPAEPRAPVRHRSRGPRRLRPHRPRHTELPAPALVAVLASVTLGLSSARSPASRRSRRRLREPRRRIGFRVPPPCSSSAFRQQCRPLRPSLFLAIALTRWPEIARLVRGEVIVAATRISRSPPAPCASGARPPSPHHAGTYSRRSSWPPPAR
jgi:hypothetical protein